MKELKLGLIGTGKFGTNYLKTKVEGVEIIETCSSARDYHELINSGLDGIIIATPTNLHFEMVKSAIIAHKPFIVEKPLTGHGDQSQELLKIYDQKPVVALVDLIYLFDPCFQALQKNLSKIGDLQRVEFYGLQSTIRTDGTTVVQDWGPHPLYIMQKLMGTPIEIGAKRLNDDNVELKLTFEKGESLAQIGWTHPTKERKIIAVGDKGKIVYDATQEQKLVLVTDITTPLEYKQTTALANLLLHFATCIRGQESPIATLKMGASIDQQIDSIHL